ncbi:MAG: hypothetical protein Q7K45_07675 [Nanoarchaeota archaeon]|nr:hypothetical protein [Nanoarchaeota archaeon]
MEIRLVSSDLNGTLIQQHSMSDMIRLYLGQHKFEQAQDVFQRQADGTATIEEAFAVAGPLTKGLRLRDALEYTRAELKYMDGFIDFTRELQKRKIPLIINSTGYSITVYAIQAQHPTLIHGSIGNNLHFGLDGDVHSTLSEDELNRFVQEFFHTSSHDARHYDRIRATGQITLGIKNEEDKANELLDYARTNFPSILPSEMVHLGDTMGDSGGIVGIARAGGLGIGFNYTSSLKEYLQGVELVKGSIALIDPKGPHSNLKNIAAHLFY